MIVLLWNLTGSSAALLPRCLLNFRAIGKVQTRISGLRDFTRSCGKTSYCLVNRGPGAEARIFRDKLVNAMVIDGLAPYITRPSTTHDDIIKWKHFPRYWPFVQGFHRSQVNSPHKGQWRGALMCTWTNNWVNNRGASDLRHHYTHYDVTVMWNK